MTGSVMEELRDIQQRLSNATQQRVRFQADYQNLEQRAQGMGEAQQVDEFQRAVQEGKVYEQTVRDLVAGLNAICSGRMDFLHQYSSFQGPEKLWSLLGKVSMRAELKAKNMRQDRMERQGVSEQLKTISSYVEQVVAEVLEGQIAMKGQYEGLAAQCIQISDRMREMQPELAAAKEQLEAITKEYETQNTQLQAITDIMARPTLQAVVSELATQKQDAEEKHRILRAEFEGHSTQIYKVQTQRDTCEQIHLTLLDFATQMHTANKNLYGVLQSMPEILKTKERVEGAEAAYETLNKAGEESVRMGAIAREAILTKLGRLQEQPGTTASVLRDIEASIQRTDAFIEAHKARMKERQGLSYSERLAREAEGKL